MATSTTYFDKPVLESKKPGALRLFLVYSLLFQGRSAIYKMIGLLAWINITLLGYMAYAVFQKFAIHY